MYLDMYTKFSFHSYDGIRLVKTLLLLILWYLLKNSVDIKKKLFVYKSTCGLKFDFELMKRKFLFQCDERGKIFEFEVVPFVRRNSIYIETVLNLSLEIYGFVILFSLAVKVNSEVEVRWRTVLKWLRENIFKTPFALQLRGA